MLFRSRRSRQTGQGTIFQLRTNQMIALYCFGIFLVVRLGLVVVATGNPYFIGSYVLLVLMLCSRMYRRYQLAVRLSTQNNFTNDDDRNSFWDVHFVGDGHAGQDDEQARGVRPDILTSFTVFKFKGDEGSSGGAGGAGGDIELKDISPSFKSGSTYYDFDALEKSQETTKRNNDSISTTMNGHEIAVPTSKMPHLDIRSCSICLERYQGGELICELPCNHSFHDGCIKQWLSSHVHCPLCNRDLDATAASEGGGLEVSIIPTDSSAPSADPTTATEDISM